MSAQRSNREEQATEISAAISSIHRTAFERHLSSVDTMVSEVCVASVLRFEVAPAERFVADAGGGDVVMRLYDAAEQSVEPALRAAVERTTGRTVIAFQSSMNPELGLIVEAFVLAPAA
jgi:uncharacterized protein YbcI